jgi:hypothetical protein
MNKHIPTLTILFFEEHSLYGYEYDDVGGLTQTEYGYLSLDAALGNAFKHLKTFLVLPDVETR